MQISNVLSKWQLVPLQFSQVDLAAAQTAVALYVEEGTGTGTYVGIAMPFAGEIIGVSLTTTAAATAGSLTIVPTIDTTVVTLPSVAITTAVKGSATCKRATNVFAKNAVIGAKITTTAAWDATGADLIATVWVLQKIEGI